MFFKLQKSSAEVPTKIVANENESRKSKSEKSAIRPCQTSDSPSPTPSKSELGKSSHEPTKEKKERTPKSNKKENSEKKCSRDNSESARSISPAPHITRNVPENAKGRPEKNTSSQKLGLENRTSALRDKCGSDDSVCAKNANQKMKITEEPVVQTSTSEQKNMPSSSLECKKVSSSSSECKNVSSSSQAVGKVSSSSPTVKKVSSSSTEQKKKMSSSLPEMDKESPSGIIEKQDEGKNDDDFDQFKSAEAYGQFRTCVVERFPFLKEIVEDCFSKKKDIIPILLINLPREQVIVVQELLLMYGNPALRYAPEERVFTNNSNNGVEKPSKSAEPAPCESQEPVPPKPVEPITPEPKEPVSSKPVEPVSSKPVEPVPTTGPVPSKPADLVLPKPVKSVSSKPVEPVLLVSPKSAEPVPSTHVEPALSKSAEPISATPAKLVKQVPRDKTPRSNTQSPELKIQLCDLDACGIPEPAAACTTGKIIRKRKKDELETLREYNSMMSESRANNILTVGTVRACRKQTLSYSQSFPRIEALDKLKVSQHGKKTIYGGLSSDTEDDDEERLTRQKKRPKKLENDQKSKKKGKTSGDVEDESESKFSESAEMQPREAEATTSNNGQCRKAKLEIKLYKLNDQDLNRLSSSDRDPNSSTTTLDGSLSETNEEASWCIDRTGAQSKKAGSSDSKSSSVAVKPQNNEKIMLRLKRHGCKKFERYRQGVKQRGKRKRRRSKKYISDSSEQDVSDTDSPTKATGKLESDVEEDKTDQKMEERIKDLPKRSLLKGASENITLEIITIGMDKGEVMYSCRRAICDFRVRDVKDFAHHLYSSHKKETWDGKCGMCHLNLNKKCDFIDALSHLVNEHMMDHLPMDRTTDPLPEDHVISSPPEEHVIDSSSEDCGTERAGDQSAIEAISANNDSEPSETNTIDVELEEKIANLPKRNWIKGDIKKVVIGPIAAIGVTGKLIFTCNPTMKCNYDTDDVVMFANHLGFLHKDLEWSGWCHLCELQTEQKKNAVDALIHLVNDHLIFLPPTPALEPVPESPVRSK